MEKSEILPQSGDQGQHQQWSAMLMAYPLIGCNEKGTLPLGSSFQKHHPSLILRKISGKFQRVTFNKIAGQ